MDARRHHAAVALLAVPALLGAALAVPSSARPAAPAAAKPARTPLVLTPTRPIVGEQAVLSGRVPKPARRAVRLQFQQADGSWRQAGRARTSSDRTFRFLLPSAAERAVAVRVVAPPTGSAHRVRFSPVRYVGDRRTVRLFLPTEARAGEPVVATAVVSPARPGRTVRLRLGPDVVDSATQDAHGRVVLDATAPATGLHSFTAVAAAGGGADEVVSAPVVLRTTNAIAGIPRIDIVTDDGDAIASESTYERATVTVDPRGSGVPSFSASTRLRVRGNFTATVAAKLPYRLKLDTSTGLMGLPKSKDWVLLANYFDRTLLRTTLGMEIGRRLGLPWSPRMVDVEVRLNGELKGVYQLGEAVKTDGDRVDIDVADEGSTDASAGGFLLEVDVHPDTDPKFETARGMQVYVKEPEEATDEFVAGVAGQLDAFEGALYSASFRDPATGYARLIDVDSFVDWYLTNELFKTVDAGMFNSVYLVRDVGGRLAMGPPWDFDIGAGNRVPWDGTSATGWFLRQNWYGDPHGPPSQLTGPEGQWFVRLLQDPAFAAAVRTRWSEVRAGLFALPSYVASRRALVQEAALRNFTPTADGGAGFVTTETTPDPEFAFRHWPTWDASTDALVAWLTERMTWMDGQLS